MTAVFRRTNVRALGGVSVRPDNIMRESAYSQDSMSAEDRGYHTWPLSVTLPHTSSMYIIAIIDVCTLGLGLVLSLYLGQ